MKLELADPHDTSEDWKALCRQIKKFFILCFIVATVTGSYHILTKETYHYEPEIKLIPTSEPMNNLIELTVRTTLKEEMMGHLLCSLLRSASVSWNGNYGDVVIILDEEEKFHPFEHQLKSLGLPFTFRFVYEEPPRNVESFKRLARDISKSFGYVKMLYSSFLMDKYTTASVIAWIDTDVVFTMPVINESIYRNGKLIVKGMNTLRQSTYVNRWNHSTWFTLGLPMVSNFMSYFPVYVYRSTIRNCRKYIMQRFGLSDFELAFFKMTFTLISPVNIMMSYAYYFERHRYNWHIDIGIHSLQKYNDLNLPRKYWLTKRETLPELHVSIHQRYYHSEMDPLQQALCYAQFSIGTTNLPHCSTLYGKPNLQLFEFQKEPVANNLDTWCRPRDRWKCLKVIENRYNAFSNLYRKNASTLSLDTSWINIIENFAYREYELQCSSVTYQVLS